MVLSFLVRFGVRIRTRVRHVAVMDMVRDRELGPRVLTFIEVQKCFVQAE